MRKLALFCAAFLLATLAFWATMFTDPPRSIAFSGSEPQTLDPNSLPRPDVPMGEPADAF
jgi:hypothetical protein